MQQPKSGTDSKTGVRESYPAWLRDLFTLMSVTYTGLWNDAISDDYAFRAAQKVWYIALRDFHEDHIRKGIIEAVKIYRFPPRPAEVIEQVKNFKDRAKDIEDQRIMDENRLLPKPERKPPSRAILLAKLEMWRKLGLIEKMKQVEDEITRLDMQKERDRMSPEASV